MLDYQLWLDQLDVVGAQIPENLRLHMENDELVGFDASMTL